MSSPRFALLAAAILVLSACFGSAQRPTTLPATAVPTNPAAVPPLPSLEVPLSPGDAVPRIEPRSRAGNPPYYDVFGKRYYVLSSSSDYLERGVASWYGPGFHQSKTSMGESYDQYAMSAAHKTLPLPAYVRVTNLQNGRSCVVRVNDRGPFVGNRIIDLSFAAATRLDMLRGGTAIVEVRALDPLGYSAGSNKSDVLSSRSPNTPATASVTAAPAASATATQPTTVTPVGAAPAPATAGGAPASRPATPGSTVPAALYIQAGAFADPVNAERLAAKLRTGAYGTIFVRDDVIAGRKMFRVRIGPVANVPAFDRIVAALEKSGVHDAHLAMD